MPTHDGVRVHDDQGCAPILPRVGEQHPKQSISVAELGTPHGALEHGQLLTECQILERDRSVSTADQPERSKPDDERSQHELSCPAISHRINRGRRSDSGERQDLPLDRLATVANLSLTEGAAALGVSRSTLKRWRRGQKSLPPAA
jgi:hypothetical protein